MRGDILALIVIGIYWLGYKFYSKYLADKVFKLDDRKKTPAHKQEDGVDFVPTRKHILFGHHFASIAGAAPIIGPCIAVFWGWVPALVWVVLGNIFMGAVHDMATLFASVRHKARSIASISGDIINRKARIAFLFIVLFLLWIVAAAFSVVIAKLFVAYPAAVIPVNGALVLALIMGYLLYVRKIPALVPSLVALALLYLLIPVGMQYPVDLTQIFAWTANGALVFWVVFLMIYGFVASVLPVWVLLQPRDYINSHQLIVALVTLLVAIFVAQPEIVAPAFNVAASDAPPIFPFLFITIACGAISGAHGLVSSGTTSKQLNKETDMRRIGYGSMLIEGTLALLAIIAATAGFANTEAWHDHYNSWTHASKHGMDAFIHGAANFLTNIGIAQELGMIFIAVIIIGFASTTLDTVFRIQRFIVAELGEELKVPEFGNRYLGSTIAVVTVLLLIFSNGFGNLSGAFALWPLFGVANQVLASLALFVVALYIFRRDKKDGDFWLLSIFSDKKPKLSYLAIMIPAVIMLILTLISNLVSITEFIEANNFVLASISIVLFVLQVTVVYQGSKQL